MASYLKPSLSKKLVSRPEWYLNDGREFCHLLCGIVLNIRDTLIPPDEVNSKVRVKRSYLKVGYELLYDSLPRYKTLDEDIRGAKILRGDVLLDQRLGAREG